jgi:signal transduction histidine kinase
MAMKGCWIGIWLLALIACGPSEAFAQSTAKRILLLHQSGGPGAFRGRFDVAFVDGIHAVEKDPIELYEELIDTHRFPGADQIRLVTDYLRQKYAGRRIDVVVTQGALPLTFVRQNREIFGNPPIVAIAASSGLVDGSDGVTGLQGGYWINGSIDLALSLRPRTRSVVVIDGSRANGNALLQGEIERQVQARQPPLTLEYLRNRPLAEVVARVSSLPDTAMVLFVRQTMQDASQDVDQIEALTRITTASRVPVYSQAEDFLGRGIVGGYVWRFEEDARRMAAIALRIANGVDVRDIPVERATYATLLDWRQLRRYNLANVPLPADSVVVFRPQSFLEAYRRYAVAALAIIAAQFALIGGLLAQRVRRRRAEEQRRRSEDALVLSEARNTAMLRAIPDLMFVMQRDGTYLDYHAKDPRLLFAPPERFLGRNVRDVMPAPLAELFLDALERACAGVEPIVVEYELPMGGVLHYFEARLVQSGGDRVLSIVRDVTQAKRALELNRDLAGRLIASQELERQRIARELHDDVSQKIALLNIELDQVAAQHTSCGGRPQLEALSAQVGMIASDLHNLSHALHPSKLQTVGLVAAVRSLCRDVSEQGGVPVVFTHGTVPSDVDPNVSLCLYRIAQEALHNITRHSHAREARVDLAQDGSNFALQIADSGVGFDPRDDRHAGLGLVSMRERVALLRGQLAIHSFPGGGTRIGVRVPIAPVVHEAAASDYIST